MPAEGAAENASARVIAALRDEASSRVVGRV
jgi:hypothetical protein